MLDRTTTLFSHVKPTDTDYQSGGLRDFFLYRDLGVAEATHGKVIAHLVKANMAPETGTGWHRHEADFQIVIMVKGWAKFMYEDKETLVSAGDCVHQRPGIRHYLFDYSPDMEYLEIVSPADFKTVDVEPVCADSRSHALEPEPRRPARVTAGAAEASELGVELVDLVGLKLRRGDPLLHGGQGHDASCNRRRRPCPAPRHRSGNA
jgi:quercetin dioxygenase-like cupin family protein